MSKKLVADGMFFFGIDVIGDKVVEINAESPGGMQSVERLYEIDVCQPSSKLWSAAPARSPEPLDSSGELKPRPPLERPSRCEDMTPECRAGRFLSAARVASAPLTPRIQGGDFRTRRLAPYVAE